MEFGLNFILPGWDHLSLRILIIMQQYYSTYFPGLIFIAELNRLAD